MDPSPRNLLSEFFSVSCKFFPIAIFFKLLMDFCHPYYLRLSIRLQDKDLSAKTPGSFI